MKVIISVVLVLAFLVLNRIIFGSEANKNVIKLQGVYEYIAVILVALISSVCLYNYAYSLHSVKASLVFIPFAVVEFVKGILILLRKEKDKKEYLMQFYIAAYLLLVYAVFEFMNI